MAPQRPHTDLRDHRPSRPIVPSESGSDANRVVRIGSEPIDLILRAYDELDQGILIIAQNGLISHYNAAYAHLRNIRMDELLGKPIELLDRRNSIIAHLRTGKMPPPHSVDFEQRRNRETVVPIREDGRLLGSMVLVTPFSAPSTDASPFRRMAHAKTPWTALYEVDDIIGESPAIQYARQLAMSAARVDSSVLLLGESGTGKELFAHAIHMASKRHHGPFVPVDCSAITRDLLEAELFGYAPGAFTGANKEGKLGKFELAEGGTVFLDEIGEMPLEMQAKLLRVLQERRIVRVGGTTPIEIDFRLIAATNRQLEKMVEEKRFRHDLLYRLDVVRIEIPALRERGEDIPVLLEHAWKMKSRELGVLTSFSPAAIRALSRYAWPGNMRELLNLVERLLVVAPNSVIEADDLPLYVRQAPSDIAIPDAPTCYLKAVVAEAEQQAIEKALRHVQGNRNAAAELVGLSRASFYRKLKEYGLTQGMREQDLFENAF